MTHIKRAQKNALIAHEYFEASDYKNALSHYKFALNSYLKQNPDNFKNEIANLYFGIATSYYYLNYYKYALRYFEKALHTLKTIYPDEGYADFVSLYFSMGSAKEKLQLQSEANGYYDKALALYQSVFHIVAKRVSLEELKYDGFDRRWFF